MKVLLDTNFLIYAAKYNIHLDGIKAIFPSSQILVPEMVFFELQKLARSKELKEREAAKLALAVMEAEKIKRIKTERKGDRAFEEIIKNAKDEEIAVATLDEELMKRLKNVAKIVLIRKKSFIAEL